MKERDSKDTRPKPDKSALLQEWRKIERAVRRKEPKEDSDYLKLVTEQDREVTELRKRKPTTRDLSQINFQSQHWWKGQLNERTMSIAEEKAALIYEGLRRREEVQRAWLEHKGANGWQQFVVVVVQQLHQSWNELEPSMRTTLVHCIQSPHFIPPMGYSTFPDKTSGREKQQRASFQILRVPEIDEPHAVKAFLRRARQFADTGFTLVAVDTKKSERVRYAFEAIAGLPQTYRKADLVHIAYAHLPSGLPKAERDTLEKKRQDGTLTYSDLDEAWSKHEVRQHCKQSGRKRASGETPHAVEVEEEEQSSEAESSDGWQTVVSPFQTKVLGKRLARNMLMEEKLFDAKQLYRDFERIDLGLIPRSSFVQRLRLR